MLPSWPCSGTPPRPFPLQHVHDEPGSPRIPGARRHGTDAPLTQRRAIFLAGHDPATKKVVSDLIREIGFARVDTGTLRAGGWSQQPGTPVYNRDPTYAEAITILAAAPLTRPG
jgi:hypothetical protein